MVYLENKYFVHRCMSNLIIAIGRNSSTLFFEIYFFYTCFSHLIWISIRCRVQMIINKRYKLVEISVEETVDFEEDTINFLSLFKKNVYYLHIQVFLVHLQKSNHTRLRILWNHFLAEPFSHIISNIQNYSKDTVLVRIIPIFYFIISGLYFF